MCDTCAPRLDRRRLLAGLGASVAAVPLLAGAAGATADDRRPHRVLVFSRTTGFRHASIEVGVETIRMLGEQHGFEVEHTEQSRDLRARSLRGFTAVCFLNTTGNVLGDRSRAALRDFLLSGGGWAGVHSAADTEYDWPFYTRILAGSRFLCHPVQQPGVIVREDADHRSTTHLPERWQVPFEEFYSFTQSARPRAQVLLSIDESSYAQDPNTSNLPSQEDPSPQEGVTGTMGDHPMAWWHRVGDGVAWYTALGHEVGMYADPDYRDHLLGGLLTATRHGRRHLPG